MLVLHKEIACLSPAMMVLRALPDATLFKAVATVVLVLLVNVILLLLVSPNAYGNEA